MMHDRDTKFAGAFDTALVDAGLQVQRSAYRSPNTCAFVERFIQTLGQECLDHFIVLGQRHLDYLVSEFVDHYHLERPHHSLDNHVVVRRAIAGRRPIRLRRFLCEKWAVRHGSVGC